jgi:arylsulfatase A-like enzyme
MTLPRRSRVSLPRVWSIACALAVVSACGEKSTVTPSSQPDTITRRPDTVRTLQPLSGQRPNIVFLLADDMRWDAAHVTGNTVVQTPNIDNLAAGGVVFRNAYVTSPVCAISRASIFTGQYERRHLINDFDTEMSPAQVAQSYPTLFHDAGYRTGFIGKYGVGTVMPTTLFDYWKGFAGQGSYETRDSAGIPVHLTELMSRQAVSFLQSQPKDKPFMLSISFKAPHVQDGDPRIFIPDARDATMYESMEMPMPMTARDDKYWKAFPEFFRTNNEGRIRWADMYSTPARFQSSLKGYFRLVTGMDRAIGEVRSELARLGLDGNTIFVFTSDNGFHFGELGLSGKWYGYDPSVRVPLIVYDPRTNGHGRVESRIALNVDLAPTMLEMAGLKTPSSMQGTSLIPLIRNESLAWRQDFLFEHLMSSYATIRRSSGVIGGRFKYLRYLDPVPNYEALYDMVLDPNETTDLAHDPAYQSQLLELRARHDQLVAAAR